LRLLRSLRLATTGLVFLAVLHAGSGVGEAAEQPSPADEGVTVTIYPLLVRAPIFGASIDLPGVPTSPGTPGGDEGGAASGSTGISLNGAYMAGMLVESDRWFGEAYGLWAALSASRTSPRVAVDNDTYFVTARGGYRLFGGVAATAGVRAIHEKLTGTITLPIIDRTVSGTATDTLWDPMIGVDWRAGSKRLFFDADFQGGGFGVGMDVDLSADARVRWRVLKHLELRAGYSVVHFKWTVANVSIGELQRTLVTKQTLNGPEIGFGIVF
jgi:hypothetical protein